MRYSIGTDTILSYTMEIVIDDSTGVPNAQPVPEKKSFLKYTPAMEVTVGLLPTFKVNRISYGLLSVTR